MSKKQLLTFEDATRTKSQHKKPCSDCPWARKALRGWLADIPPEDWIASAHGEAFMECHTRIKADGSGAHQCAGAAIYRSNVAKRCRSADILRLPADRDLVFATHIEFKEHHKREDKNDS